MLKPSTHPHLFYAIFAEHPDAQELKPGVLDRMRCSVCGRRGGMDVRLGWSLHERA